MIGSLALALSSKGKILNRLSCGFYALSCLNQATPDLHERRKWYVALDCMGITLGIQNTALIQLLKGKSMADATEMLLNAVTNLYNAFNNLSPPKDFFQASDMLSAGDKLLQLIKLNQANQTTISAWSSSKLICDFFDIDVADSLGLQLILKTKAVLALITVRQQFLEQKLLDLKPKVEA